MILKHIQKDHKNEENEVEFEMKMTKSFNRPISRIINEGIRIKNRDEETLLNSKNEHFGPSIKRKMFENTWKCDKCHYTFDEKEKLQVHMKHNLIESTVDCDICSGKFKNETVLKKHFMKLHKNIHNDEPYVCDKYHVKVASKDTLVLVHHMKTIHNDSQMKNQDNKNTAIFSVTNARLS